MKHRSAFVACYAVRARQRQRAHTAPVLAKYSSTRRMPMLYPLRRGTQRAARRVTSVLRCCSQRCCGGAQFVQLRGHVLHALLAVVHELRA